MNTFTEIKDVGRVALISKINDAKGFRHTDTILGIGDDAAVVRISDYESALLSSDTFVESVDFDLVITPLQHLGYKLVVSALNDIYAMNGKPTGVLINLAIPNKFSAEMIDLFYSGVHFACDSAECEVLGGDITASRGAFIVTVTVYGKSDAEKVVYRSGAKIGDALCVTGDLGGAMAGLRILLREKSGMESKGLSEFQPDLTEYEYVVKKQLVPDLKLDFFKKMSALEMVPTSMMDVTKGLMEEIKTLTQASGVGVKLYQAAIPIAQPTRDVADEMETDVDKYALYGGEEFEFLFTLPEKQVNQLFKVYDDFSVIGKIVSFEQGVRMQTAEGDELEFQ